jgi:osmotically-inducible protein OsmY
MLDGRLPRGTERKAGRLTPDCFSNVQERPTMNPSRVPDSKIVLCAQRQLSRCGIRAPCRVTISSNRGEVTLSGTLQYEHQRHAAMQSIQSVEGVRRIIDRLTVLPAPRRT